MNEFQINVAKFMKLQERVGELKTLNTELRKVKQNILDYMRNTNIQKCTAGDVCLGLEQKKKMPPMGGKLIMSHAQKYFNITDDRMADFKDHLKTVREKNCEMTHCLTQKKVVAAATAAAAAAAPVLPSSMPSAVSDLYS